MRSGSYFMDVSKEMCMELDIEHSDIDNNTLEELLNKALCSNPKCKFDVELEDVNIEGPDEDGIRYSETEFSISYQTKVLYSEATRWEPGDYEELIVITDDDIEYILKSYFKEHNYKIDVCVHECSANYNEW